MNPRPNLPNEIECPDPHSCCNDINVINEDDFPSDFMELVNCTQRHVCRIGGYCVKKNKNSETTVVEKCRFDFPKKCLKDSELKFIETVKNVKVNLNLSRNDPYMNAHIPIVAHHVDSQLILDYHAAIY